MPLYKVITDKLREPDSYTSKIDRGKLDLLISCINSSSDKEAERLLLLFRLLVDREPVSNPVFLYPFNYLKKEIRQGICLRITN